MLVCVCGVWEGGGAQEALATPPTLGWHAALAGPGCRRSTAKHRCTLGLGLCTAARFIEGQQRAKLQACARARAHTHTHTCTHTTSTLTDAPNWEKPRLKMW